MIVLVKWGDVPEHILQNAREGVYGTGRIVRDDYEIEIHENLLNTNLISKIVSEACELSNEELEILIDRCVNYTIKRLRYFLRQGAQMSNFAFL